MSEPTDLLTHGELAEYKEVMGELITLVRARAAAAMQMSDALAALTDLSTQHRAAYRRQEKICESIAKKRGKTLDQIADIDAERSLIVWKAE